MKLLLSSETLQVINLLISIIIPAVVAFVTKRYASSSLKSIVLTALAALLAVLVEIADSGGFVLFDAVMLFAQNFFMAVASHYGLLKPTGITGSEGAVAKAVPSGLGKSAAA